MAAESWKDLYEEHNSCHPVMLDWFSIQILVNSEIFFKSFPYTFNPLSPNIHIQILQTDLHTSLLTIS